MARFPLRCSELFLLINTVVGVSVPVLGPLDVIVRLDIWDTWIELSVITPLIIMNFLIALSWLLLAAINTTRFSKAHSERTVKLGFRRSIYFVLLVATIVLFWPILIRALSPRITYLWIAIYPGPHRPEWGLIRPSPGVNVSLFYFFIMVAANISVWGFGHMKELRTANRQ